MYIWSRTANLKTFRKYHNQFARSLIMVFLGIFILVGVNFVLEKTEIRNKVFNQIRSGIAPEKLIQFSFTKLEVQQLNWKKVHEFEFEGEMYDIVASNIVNDIIQYTCFHDTKETKLKRRLYKFLSQFIDSDHHNDSDNQRTNSIQKVYFNQYSCFDDLVNRLFVSRNVVPYYLSLYSYEYLDISPPPPKVI